MGTKTISIMDDVYDGLVALKIPGESFSDELRRLTKVKGNIMDLAGCWKDITEEESKKIKTKVLEMRKGTRLKEIREKML